MTLKVKVIPRSRVTEFAGDMADGNVKVRVAAAPEDGKANLALCAFLAQHYNLPASEVRVISGQTSPGKLVRVGT